MSLKGVNLRAISAKNCKRRRHSSREGQVFLKVQTTGKNQELPRITQSTGATLENFPEMIVVWKKFAKRKKRLTKAPNYDEKSNLKKRRQII